MGFAGKRSLYLADSNGGLNKVDHFVFLCFESFSSQTTLTSQQKDNRIVIVVDQIIFVGLRLIHQSIDLFFT